MSNRKLKTLLLPQLVEERERRKEMDMYLSSCLLEDYPILDHLLSLVSSRNLIRNFDESCDSTLLEPSLTYSSTGSLSSQSLGLRSRKPSLPNVQEEAFGSEEFFYGSEDEIDITYTEIDDSELYCCLCDDPHCLHRNTNEDEISVKLMPNKLMASKKSMNRFVSRLGTKYLSTSRRKVARNNAQPTSSFESFPDFAPLNFSYDESCEENPTNCFPGASLPEMPKFHALNIKDLGMTNMSKSYNQSHEEIRHKLNSPSMGKEVSAKRKASNSSRTLASAVMRNPNSSDDDRNFVDLEKNQSYRPSSQLLRFQPSISSLVMCPVSENSGFDLSNSDDKWSKELGHFNFTIFPVPYLPQSYDKESYRKFLYDWDLARNNYTQHIACICENCGATSKIYQLVEEKWRTISEEWESKNKLIFKVVHDEYCITASDKKPYMSPERVSVSVPHLESSGENILSQDEEIVLPVGKIKRVNTQPTKRSRILNFLKKKKSLSR